MPASGPRACTSAYLPTRRSQRPNPHGAARANTRMRLPDDDSAITQLQPAFVNIAPRVLIVDDDELIVAHLSGLVSAAGYEVETATTGHDALAALQREF